MNPILLTQINYGIKRHFKTFRKKLRRQALDFKFGTRNTHKNQHAIPLQLRRKLMNSKKGGDWHRIHQLEEQSMKPFGRITKKGRFLMDKQRIPFYDIPNIEGCQLKPYVEFNAPKLEEKYLNHQILINKEKLTQMGETGVKLVRGKTKVF